MKINDKKKILELCLYSAGIDGVFARVKHEAKLLSEKGYNVRIFSSNIEKGSNKIVSKDDKIGNVLIKRFSTRKMPFSESYMVWDRGAFERAVVDFKPDIIIAHSYRHSHTHLGLDIAKKIHAKCFLVTHAPFGSDENRSLAARYYVKFFDRFIGRRRLREFTKIIAITNWEREFLHNLMVPLDKIAYIPNGIPSDFFSKKKKTKEQNKILFLGRISPVKDIETLISAMPLLHDKKIKLEIVGMAEKEYLQHINEIIRENKIGKRVSISPAIFDIEGKIKKIDSAKIFVLPSKREGMPQSLVEAMARGKIVVASEIAGNKELVDNGKNGFLFNQGDSLDCARIIDRVLLMRKKNISLVEKNARNHVLRFDWKNIVAKIEKVINSD